MGSFAVGFCICKRLVLKSTWLVLNKLPANLLVAKPLGSNLLPRLPVSLLRLQEESKNLIVIVLEQWHSVRSENTKSPLNCCFASCHSNVWSARSLRISRVT